MAGFHTAAMPRPQLRARPATPIVDIALVRPEQAGIQPRVSRRPPRMTEEQKAHACRLVADGWSMEAVAAELGFGSTAIKRATKGIDRTAAVAMADARRAAREALQAEVRRLKKLGLSDNKVAKQLNISRRYVRFMKASKAEYERYLAKMRKRTKANYRKARKENHGIGRNFLWPTACGIKVATGIGLDELKALADSTARPPALVRARQILCWLAVSHRGLRPTWVGQELGIDHSTVINAVQAVQAAADAIALPKLRAINAAVKKLMAEMQRADTERRQAASRPTEIPTP